MIPFCGNPKCQYHKLKVKQSQYRIEVERDNARYKIDRHMYANAEGNKFELCTVCHNAIEMIKKQQAIDSRHK